MDGRNIWTVGMDRWTAWRDGQDGWEYGMNHTDRKDEEEIDDDFFFFFFLLSIFFLFHLPPHTHFVSHFSDYF